MAARKQKQLTLVYAGYLMAMISMLAISMIALSTFVLPMIKADESQGVAGLLAPYIDLVNPRKSPQGDSILVDVIINTNQLEVIAVDTVVNFDPAVLQLAEQPVLNHDVFSVMNVNSITATSIDFSVFSNPGRGEPPVSTTTTDIVIATLAFTILDSTVESTKLTMSHIPGNITDSNMIETYDERPSVLTDVLMSTGTLTILLNQ